MLRSKKNWPKNIILNEPIDYPDTSIKADIGAYFSSFFGRFGTYVYIYSFGLYLNRSKEIGPKKRPRCGLVLDYKS